MTRSRPSTKIAPALPTEGCGSVKHNGIKHHGGTSPIWMCRRGRAHMWSVKAKGPMLSFLALPAGSIEHMCTEHQESACTVPARRMEHIKHRM
eukprot:1089859-Pelagomonas_calceolata.AAC.3